jgi:hypothetical protein
MRLIVTQEFKGSPDGCTVRTYTPGEQDLPDALAVVALQEGWARQPAPILEAQTHPTRRRQRKDRV